MTHHLTKLLPSAFIVAALATTGYSAPAQADIVTPAQWLQRQPKPVFKPGHTLPRLTRFGWDLSYETHKVLAEDWDYVLQTNYLSDEVVARLDDPNSREAKMAALTLSNPQKYPFGVILDRSEPPNPAPQTFLRDAAGNLVRGEYRYSPLNPQSVLDQMAELRARPLRNLRARLPINMILNGGEYGLGIIGDYNYFPEDPAVAASQAQSGDDWFHYISKAKGHELDTVAAAVRAAVPDRSLYIYYATGSTERNRYWGWKQWSGDEADSINASDLPASELYYKDFNDGYDATGGNDMLSRALNAKGYEIGLGKKLSYEWLTAGYHEAGSPPVYDPAVSTSTYISSINLYTGFLKCIFTAGTIGGNAGYYSLPTGGFDAAFETSQPPIYLPQMTALSQVQSLFSYLESDVRNSDLLPGPNMHAKSTDQPAYEFPTGSAGARVVARKVTGADKWIITAWASDGVERTVRVTIPTLGNIALSARATGSVYIATIVNNQMQLSLTDSNGLTPTVGGYAPVDVTPATPNPTNALVNGGFETPVLSGGGAAYAYNPTGSNWNFASNSGIQRNGSDWGGANAPEGSQTAFLQGYSGGLGSMGQIVSFAAGTYKVQFQAAQRPTDSGVQPIQVKVDGVNVGSPITPSSSSFALYTSAEFTVIPGNHQITFAATNEVGGKGSFVDDVRIVVISPPSTPVFVNGSFEAPVLSGGGAAYVYNPTGAGWSFASNSGIQRNGSAWGAANAPEGSQTAFLQGYSGGLGEISQSVSFAAGTYQVQFQAAQRPIYSGLQPIQVKVDGVNVGSTITPTSNSFAIYTSANFTVSAGNHTISLSATDASTAGKASIVDDVRIVIASPPAVPTLVNGGFETPVLSGGSGAYVYNPTGAGWSFASNSGMQRNGSAWGVANAPEGSQTAFLQGYTGALGEISQSASFGAGTYKVQFQAARRPYDNGGLQPIQVKVDGVNMGSTITPTSNSFATYSSASFTVAVGNHTISLSATDASAAGKSSMIDDIKIF